LQQVVPADVDADDLDIVVGGGLVLPARAYLLESGVQLAARDEEVAVVAPGTARFTSCRPRSR
jgi:hypothetical protein